MKIIRVTFISGYIISLLLLALIQLWSQSWGYGFSVSNWIYWLILMGLIVIVLYYRKKSSFFLKIGLVLFLIGVTFTVINLIFVAETIFRISFIFWLVGIIKALQEYRSNMQ